ncbi:MAG: hypothetical protein II951_13780 [Bacteroidales bacterium]|nr:hypothetical protein [Bacteroidales bacterium]
MLNTTTLLPKAQFAEKILLAAFTILLALTSFSPFFPFFPFSSLSSFSWLDQLLIFVGGLLAILYYFLGYLVTGEPFTFPSRNLFTIFDRLSRRSGFLLFLWQFPLPLAVIGTMFKALHFPGSRIILLTAIIVLPVALLVLCLPKFRTLSSPDSPDIDTIKSLRIHLAVALLASLFMLFIYPSLSTAR